MSDIQPPPPPDLPRWTVRVGMASWFFIGFCAAVTLLAIILAATRAIVIPLVLGIVLAVVFDPLNVWIRRHRVPPRLAAATVVLLVVGTAVGSGAIVAAGLADQGDELADRTDEAIADLRQWLDDLSIDADLADQARETVNNSMSTLSAGFANQLVGAVGSAAGIVTGTILGLIVLYYLLKDGSALVDRFIERQAPDRSDQLRRIADRSAHQIQAYAKGRTILAAINGIAIGLAAAVLGIPLAFAITVVNFVGSYVPYIGGFVGGAFAFLLALSAGGLQPAVAIVVVSLLVNLLLENALEPVLLGDHLEMHPLVVLLVTVVGGLMAGLVGLILAAPVTAIGLNIYQEIKATGFFDD